MKKIHWFTTKNTVFEGQKEISIKETEIIKQISKVLRLEVGESIVLKTETSAFDGVLSEISRDEIKVSNIKEKERITPHKRISLFFCIPKKDKFELILEKCTEIGVTDFYPVISDRTIKTNINIERSNKIIEEASEQTQRIDTPNLHSIQNIDDIIKEYRPTIFDVEGEIFKLNENKALLNFLIGPEGGFSQREIALFKDEKLDIYKIGENVLKTETAAIVISALLTQ